MPICADVACKIEALLLDLASEIYGATAPECLDVATKRYLRSLKEFAVYMDHASYSIFLLEKSCSSFYSLQDQFKGSLVGTHSRAILLAALGERTDWLTLVEEGARQSLTGRGPLVQVGFEVQDLLR